MQWFVVMGLVKFGWNFNRRYSQNYPNGLVLTTRNTCEESIVIKLSGRVKREETKQLLCNQTEPANATTTTEPN